MRRHKKTDQSKCAQITGIVNKTVQPIEKIASMAWKAVSFDSLPGWLQDNEYLLDHHRPPMYSIRGCIKSIFRLHTQTLNIWTHLIGCILFLVMTLTIFFVRDRITHIFDESVTISDLGFTEQLVMFIFFLSAIICLFCSTMFHTLNNYSSKAFLLFSRIDYSGIAILITGSNIPAYYFSFYCMPLSRIIHITMIVILCVACIMLSLWYKFNTPEYRPLRTMVFVLFGFYGAIPTIEMFLLKGTSEPYFSFFIGLALMAFLYTSGAILYVFRIPERFSPGLFDVWGHSHQLFHICVIMAALVHYHTLVSMIKHHLTTSDCQQL
jgi:adiponectin receptor